MATETTHGVATAGTRHTYREHPLVDRVRRVSGGLRRPAVLTVLAGLAGVVLTLVVLPPPMYGDSYWIWRSAQMWPNVATDFPLNLMHHALRLGTVLPTRVVQEILGPGQVAWVVTSSLFMAVFTAGVFAIGRSLFSTWVGLGTLGLIVVHPFLTDVDDFVGAASTSTGGLVPDAPAAGLYALGVAAFVVASRRRSRPQVWWLVAGGLSMGLAYLVREFIAVMFVAIPIYFLLLRIPWRRLVIPAIPMTGVFAFELVHNAIVYSDPFARLTVTGEHGGRLASPIPLGDVLAGFYDAMVTDRLGWLFLAGLVVTVVGVAVFRDRRLILLLAWFLSLWLPLTLLGGLIDPWEPNLRVFLVRYWTAVFAPLLVGGLATVGLLVQRMRRAGFDRRPLFAGLALVAVGYVVAAGAVLARVHRDEDWRDLRGWLADHPEVTALYSDERTAQTASFYAMGPGGDPLWRGSFLTFRHRIEDLPADRIGHTPYLQTRHGARERPDPADGWQVLWRSDNGILTIWRR